MKIYRANTEITFRNKFSSEGAQSDNETEYISKTLGSAFTKPDFFYLDAVL